MAAARAAAAAGRFRALQSRRSHRRRHVLLPPVFFSASPSHADPAALRELLLACGHSCLHPLSPSTRGAVDMAKLETALANSSVVVSAFCKERFLDGGESASWEQYTLLGGVIGGKDERRLVGFGRAVSDGAITASIHDVVVLPSLQRRGIGRKIVDKIVRLLTNRGIYDISALCTEKEREFFEKCGFGDDSLGSVTMMFTGDKLRVH